MRFTLEEFRTAVRERVDQLRSGRPPIQRVESTADMDIILIFEVLDALMAKEQDREGRHGMDAPHEDDSGAAAVVR